jgi:hypothetical protein
MEKKNEALVKRLAAQSNATPGGYKAVKHKLANLGASMTALQGQVGSTRHAGKGDRGGKGGRGGRGRGRGRGRGNGGGGRPPLGLTFHLAGAAPPKNTARGR